MAAGGPSSVATTTRVVSTAFIWAPEEERARPVVIQPGRVQYRNGNAFVCQSNGKVVTIDLLTGSPISLLELSHVLAVALMPEDFPGIICTTKLYNVLFQDWNRRQTGTVATATTRPTVVWSDDLALAGFADFDEGLKAFVADHSNNAILSAYLDSNEPAALTTFVGSGVWGARDGIGLAAQFQNPRALAVSLDETLLFVGDAATIRVVQIETAAVRTLAGSTLWGDTDGIGIAARFYGIQGLVVGPCGTLFCTDSGNHRIRAITPSGVVSTLAGNGVEGVADGPFGSAAFERPYGIALGPGTSLLVTDQAASRLRVLHNAIVAPVRCNALNLHRLPKLLFDVLQTLIVLWTGKSRRLAALHAASFRMNNCFELAILIYLFQWVQGALWTWAATPQFELLPTVL